MINTDRFIADVLQNRVNAAILQRLHRLTLPVAWLVAGCLFQTVWNLKSGKAPENNRDYQARWPWLRIQPYDLSATESAEVLQLSPRDQQRFADALLMPTAQSAAMKRAFESASKLIQKEQA